VSHPKGSQPRDDLLLLELISGSADIWRCPSARHATFHSVDSPLINVESRDNAITDRVRDDFVDALDGYAMFVARRSCRRLNAQQDANGDKLACLKDEHKGGDTKSVSATSKSTTSTSSLIQLDQRLTATQNPCAPKCISQHASPKPIGYSFLSSLPSNCMQVRLRILRVVCSQRFIRFAIVG
jgi:hypothetical protein